MQGNQTILDPPEPGSSGAQAASGRATERKTMNFTFDKSYWSAGPRDEPCYCSQQTLYDDLGKELLDHGFAGFNACILACEWTPIALLLIYSFECRRTDRSVLDFTFHVDWLMSTSIQDLESHTGTSSSSLQCSLHLNNTPTFQYDGL